MSTSVHLEEERFVVFHLAGEAYAVPIAGVHTVEKVLPITRVPRAPHFVDGVVNLRGEVIPVVNLRRRLDLPELVDANDAHIVVALAGEQLVGLLVDEISHVLSLPQESIQAADQVIGETNRSFLLGVGKWENGLIIILDLERVIDPVR